MALSEWPVLQFPLVAIIKCVVTSHPSMLSLAEQHQHYPYGPNTILVWFVFASVTHPYMPHTTDPTTSPHYTLFCY